MATLTLGEFCKTAGGIAADAPLADIPRRIADHLPGLLANDALLEPCHRRAPEGGYGRNVVFICPGGHFSLLAMVWPPGVATPIHDHKTWCAFGVYEGEIGEVRYDAADDRPDCRRAIARAAALHGAGAVGHLPFCSDIHRLHNPRGHTAISIHVYGGDTRHTGPNLERVYDL